MRGDKKEEKIVKNSANISKIFIKDLPPNPQDLDQLFNDFQNHQTKIKQQNEEVLKISPELKSSVSRYQNLYEFAPSGHFTLDMNEIIIEVNFAFSDLLGEKKINLLGKKFTEYLDSIFSEKFHEHLKEVIKSKSAQICELELIKKDGNKLSVQLKTIPLFSNEKLEFKNAILDLTKLKEVEEKYRLSARYNRCLIETSLDPLFTIATDETITDANHATEKATGFSRDELKGTNFSKYFTDPKKAQEGFWQALKKEKLKNYSLEIKHRNGHITPVLSNATVLKDKSGKIIGIFVAARDISEKIRSNEKIKQLANIVKYSDDAIIGKSLDGKITSWNKGAERIFGYSAEEIIGKHVEILRYPDINGKAKDLIQMLKEGKRLHNFETARFRKDGSKIDVSISCSPVFNSSGELIGTSTIARDISHRKNAERKLKKYQKNLEKIVKKRTKEVEFQAHLLEQVRDAIIVTDDENRIKYWNKGAEQLYHIKSDDAIGKYRDDVFKIKWLSLEDEKSSDIHLRKRGYWQGENVHIKHNGEKICVESTINKIIHARDKGFIAIIRDISERKEIENELRKSEEKYRSIVEKSRSGVFLTDSTYKVSYVNPRMAEMLGYTVKEMIGKNIFDFIDPEGQDKFIKHLRNRKEGLDNIYEVKFLNKNGSTQWMLISTNPLLNIKRKYLGSVSVMIDINARKGVEKVMIEEMKEKDQDLLFIMSNMMEAIKPLINQKSREDFKGKFT